MIVERPAPLASRELRALADLNFAESLREHARWSSHGVIDERSDVLRTVGPTRYPAALFNTASCPRETPTDPDAWLAAQRAFFASQGRGFCVYARGARDAGLAEACRRASLMTGDAPPGMVCDAPLGTPPDDPRVEIAPVESVSALRELASLIADAYLTSGLPASVTRKVMSEPERMLGPHVLWLLLRYEGTPATSAMVLFSHSIAGVYWVSTVRALRRRGLGEACTRAATNAAFARGARAVVLQATRMGEPMYRELGFREITRYPWFVSPHSA